MVHRVAFSVRARDDLAGLYTFIADRAGAPTALTYVERLERWCEGFSQFPEREARRDGIRPGLRVIGFERRVAIAFRVTDDTVVILRILYAGRDLRRALAGAVTHRQSD